MGKIFALRNFENKFLISLMYLFHLHRKDRFFDIFSFFHRFYNTKMIFWWKIPFFLFDGILCSIHDVF